MMNHELKTLGAILGCTALTAPSAQAQNKQSVRKDLPNVLLILVDDYGWNDLSATGSQFYETPNIDRIAQRGMMFVNSYAACSVSSPSRASILTGKTPARHGITNWIGDPYGTAAAEKNNTRMIQPQYVETLPKSEFTLEQALQQYGYTTMISGKWHLGDLDPTEYGFDINKGGYEAGNPKGGYYVPYNNPKLPDGPAGEDLTIRLAYETKAFIDDQATAGKPFFAYLSFYAVHAPIQTSRERWSYFRDKAEKMGIAPEGFKIDRTLPVRQVQDNPVYAGLISSVDDAVGIVMDELDRLGITDNTIVIFTSDNGGVSSGDNYSSSNLPLRGGKGRQWEGGTRVPLFMMAPSLKNPGRKETTPVIHMDLYPTILEMAGLPTIPTQHVDGVSLKPLIAQSGAIAPRAMYWHYPHYGNQGGEPASYVKEGDWKLIYYWEDNRTELYNLASDPGEETSVAESNPARVVALKNKLDKWLEETHASIPEKNASFNAELYRKQLANKQAKQMVRQEMIRKEQLNREWSPNDDWWGSEPTID